MAARAPLAWSHTAIFWPNVGTAAPATGLNFVRSRVRPGASLAKAREGRVPGGSAWSPDLRWGKSSAHKRELFPQPHYRQQTEQTNERALVENLN